MTEEAVNQQLNRAKRTVCDILVKAGYKTEKASNCLYCLTAMREAEWRVIAVGTEQVIRCSWFLSQIRNFEKVPVPDPRTIQKEVWIRGQGELNFHIYFWKNDQWVDENFSPVNIFN